MTNRISIVIPVYNVEAYVRKCLATVLQTRDVEVEVIVVEDKSTDGSLAIIRDIAAEDPRIQILELEVNSGLGTARNLGMDRAQGDWLLFLDSDDEIRPGSLKAMLDLGQATDAEVVMFDYARLYWNGKKVRNKNAGLFANNQGTVTALERPELLDNLNVAWNKLYRRSFLEHTKMRFPTGIYEDIPWTYPILLSAERIALLDRVAVLYRQRREGSILRSASTAHFDVLDQYARLFDWLTKHPEHGWAHRSLHLKMCNHLFTIIDYGERRLPRKDHRDFYSAMSSIVAKHAPADFEFSGRLGGARQRAVIANRYYIEQSLRKLKKLRNVFSQLLIKTQQSATRAKGRLGTKLRLSYYRLQLLKPIDTNLAVFCSYWYTQYSGNPKAISDAVALLAPQYRRVWLIDKASAHMVPKKEEAHVVGTWGYYRALATASILVDNSNFPNFVKHRRGTTHLQTQHGTPLKSMGMDLANRRPAGQLDFKKLMHRVDRWDATLSANRYSSEIWARAFPAKFETWEYGYPRNDIFFKALAPTNAQVRLDLEIEPAATVVMYAPTFRDHQAEPQLKLDLVSLSSVLPDHMVLIVRAHYLDTDFEFDISDLKSNVIDVSRYPDVQMLCTATDLLITDYSSIMFDYANLNRPIVLYTPDWSTYQDVRGVYFDIVNNPPGEVTHTQKDLESLLISGAFDNPDAQLALAAFRSKFCEFDSGNASELVVRRLFLREQLPNRHFQLP